MIVDLCRQLTGEALVGVDWVATITLANRALVTPALAERCSFVPGTPEDARDFLTTIAKRACERNLRLRAQLIESAVALNGEGITPLLFKGAAFLAESSHLICNRIFADLDLMVDPAEMPRALNALAAIGYSHDGADPHQSSSNQGGGADLSRDGDVGGIDLHVRFKTAYPQYAQAQLLESCEKVAIGRARVLLPSPALHAAIIVMHDQLQERDYWRGLLDLRHLLDLWRIARGRGDEFWSDLVGFFPEGHPRRALETQLHTLDWLFGPMVPTFVLGSFRARVQARRRMLQLDYPFLSHLLTGISTIIDPPLRPKSVGSAKYWIGWRAKRIAHRLFGTAAMRKV